MFLDKVQEAGPLVMVAVALVVVSILAYQGNEPALGALIGVVAAGVGYFLRGKVEQP